MPGAPLPVIYIAGASNRFIDTEFHSSNYGSWIRSGAAAQQPVAKDCFGVVYCPFKELQNAGSPTNGADHGNHCINNHYSRTLE